MPFLFALTLFVSATLLFLVQPMIGKIVLPLLGGSPAVWNTCMVFFQATLLVGYLYAHGITRRLGSKSQVVLHSAVLMLPLIPLALVGFDAAELARKWMPPPTEANPVPWLLGLLALAVGLPFLVVSTSAPLLQHWFAGTGHASGKDPYYLYAASNLGSLIALFGYPALVEPNLGLTAQGRLWVAGYGLFVLLTAACAARAWRARKQQEVRTWNRDHEQTHSHDESAVREGGAASPQAEPSVARRLRWIALAFIPSSLMLGVTTHVTTDVAAIPLLWIMPLALYLLSFILVFAQMPVVVEKVLTLGLLAAAVYGLSYIIPEVLWAGPFPGSKRIAGDLEQGLPWYFYINGKYIRWALYLILVPSLLMFLPSMRSTLHRAMVLLLPLAILPLLGLIRSDLLPWQVFLTHYAALFVAAMVCHGELARTRPAAEYLTEFYLCMSFGGVLGGLFNAMVAPVAFTQVVEYPLVIALACLILPSMGLGASARPLRWLGVAVTSVIALFGVGAGAFFLGQVFLTKSDAQDLPEPVRTCALWIAQPDWQREPILQHRGFFGIFRVYSSAGGEYHYLVHGTTNHGIQCMDEGRRDEPLSYFHREGPVGQLFKAVREQKPESVRLAVLGVGTGCLAAYAERGDRLSLFEIDPAVVRMAYDRELFTFLPDCEARGVPVDVSLGDGRLQLAKAPDAAYDLLFMDAFTSDAVPIHLLTKEAVELYLTKMAPHGILVVNIANRYLDLEPALANLAEATGLKVLVACDEAEVAIDKYATGWVVMAREMTDFGRLPEYQRPDHSMWFVPLTPKPDVGVWTDDFSSLLRVFRWKG